MLSVFSSPGTLATVTLMFTTAPSGGSRLSGSSTVAFSPLATCGTVLLSVIAEPVPLASWILTVTLTLNSSLSPWLVKATVNGWPLT